MPEHQPLDYRLRCHTKRTDLPADVLRDIGEAYAEIGRLQDDYANRLLSICADSRRFMDERDAAIKQRDEARRELCVAEAMLSPRDDQTPRGYAAERGWDCFKDNA